MDLMQLWNAEAPCNNMEEKDKDTSKEDIFGVCKNEHQKIKAAVLKLRFENSAPWFILLPLD